MLATERVAVLVTVSAGALIASAIAASTPEPDEPRPPPEVRVVPLAGELLGYAVEDAQATGGGCLPFLREMTRRPHWVLQLVEGTSACMGDVLQGTLTVTDDGWVAWSVPHMPTRNIRLTPGELATVEHLDEVSCAAPGQLDYRGGWVRVGLGDVHASGAAAVSRTTPLAQTVEQLFDAVIARYIRERRAQLGDVTIDLVAHTAGSSRNYHVRVEHDRLRITRGKRVVEETAIEPEELVDFVEWAQHEPMYPYESDVAYGLLTTRTEQLRLSLEMFAGEQLALWAHIDATLFHDEHP